MHAFIEKYARHAPRDFCRDGCSPSRGHVTAGIQQGRAAGRSFLRDGYFDDGLLVAEGQSSSGD